MRLTDSINQSVEEGHLGFLAVDIIQLELILRVESSEVTIVLHNNSHQVMNELERRPAENLLVRQRPFENLIVQLDVRLQQSRIHRFRSHFRYQFPG